MPGTRRLPARRPGAALVRQQGQVTACPAVGGRAADGSRAHAIDDVGGPALVGFDSADAASQAAAEIMVVHASAGSDAAASAVNELARQQYDLL